MNHKNLKKTLRLVTDFVSIRYPYVLNWFALNDLSLYLSLIIFSNMIKVKIIGDQIVTGTVFAVDPVTNSLIIKDEESNSFTLINSSHIQSIEGDIDFHNLPNATQCGPFLNSLEKFEAKACDLAEKNMAALNFNVTPEIQTLFDRLSFIFPCVWDGSSMLILNEFIIDPPYEQVRCVSASSDSSGLDRVIKVLDGERRKLKL